MLLIFYSNNWLLAVLYIWPSRGKYYYYHYVISSLEQVTSNHNIVNQTQIASSKQLCYVQIFYIVCAKQGFTCLAQIMVIKEIQPLKDILNSPKLQLPSLSVLYPPITKEACFFKFLLRQILAQSCISEYGYFIPYLKILMSLDLKIEKSYHSEPLHVNENLDRLLMNM